MILKTACTKRIARCGIAVGLFGISLAAFGQSKVIPLWPDGAPGSENWTQQEVEYWNERNEPMVRNVVAPTLTAFLPSPSSANGAAVIVCPGGGFRFLSWETEGTAVAKWLSARGVAAFVLKYRLVDTGATEEEFRKAVAAMISSWTNGGAAAGSAGKGRTTLPDDMRAIAALAAADGRQAIKVVRENASDWGIAPDRVGMMGFSAGAFLTMAVVMEHDAESRPNFAAPIYGGDVNGAPVAGDAPPLFILAANDDPVWAGSAELYSDWKAADRPVELHIYSKGGHGFGLRKQNLPMDQWIDRFGDWLEVQGLLRPAH